MAKCVFTTKADSGYDDDRTTRYHFPKQYLDKARQSVGDLAVYYEPRRNGGRSAYIAIVNVHSIVPDPARSDHYYAMVGGYLDFDQPVPFKGEAGLFELNLQSEGKTGLSGDFRNAVRVVPDDQFQAILAAGFAQSLAAPKRELSAAAALTGLSEETVPFDYQRPIVQQIISRPFRDEAFARHVKDAYRATCAFTGLSMRNGGGRTEVDAAHIKPVGNGHAGPDSVRNGLALSKTVHWMFDRGLLSVDADYRILKAKGLVPEPIQRMIHPSGYLTLPDDRRSQPLPKFLEYHRDHIFKDAKT